MCLEKLIERFGATNERVMGLRGLYQEAVAENDAALEKVLKEYNGVLAKNPTNTVSFRWPKSSYRLETNRTPKAGYETPNSTASDSFKN